MYKHSFECQTVRQLPPPPDQVPNPPKHSSYCLLIVPHLSPNCSPLVPQQSPQLSPIVPQLPPDRHPIVPPTVTLVVPQLSPKCPQTVLDCSPVVPQLPPKCPSNCPPVVLQLSPLVPQTDRQARSGRVGSVRKADVGGKIVKQREASAHGELMNCVYSSFFANQFPARTAATPHVAAKVVEANCAK